MPAPYRTNEDDVIATLTPGREYDFDYTPSLIPFLDAAQQLVNKIANDPRGQTYQPQELQLIEQYLAAHFYVTSDKAYASKSADGASGSFMQQSGKRFEQTPHGQTALNLDYNGVLNGIQMNARPKVISLGGEDDCQCSGPPGYPLTARRGQARRTW
jgi:hypothetical protein